MEIEINLTLGVKVIIEIVMKDMTILGSNVFIVRVRDIGLRSAQAPLKQKSWGGSRGHHLDQGLFLQYIGQ